MESRVYEATEGKIFQRIHDNVYFGKTLYLGYDYSTGEKRTDYKKYYREVNPPEWWVEEEEA